ncbi:UDP-2,3-diacylglucosamine diphosphatase [Kangiella shandongensis]|uniref:UDP-2,3-diacylglucosamine diphosphatase n=1 Tax=Kangiella shandongensis TaxID=2763258 RepID=UPI001CC016A2|nr:UDP-2,3-diacylglucosamine diphosphatase [Kangiella shandongensis]
MTLPSNPGTKRRYRTIWLSDTHLGSKGCQAQLLLEFLQHIECKKLYLVGDIIDCWRLKNRWYWPQLHNDVVQKILRKGRKGCEVIFIPGNHDSLVRNYTGMSLGSVKILEDDIHVTARGERLLVLHGDIFDNVMRFTPWLATIGDHLYEFLLKLNRPINKFRERFDKGYWSLSAHLKMKVKNAVSYISQFEKIAAEHASKKQADGIVCGHIHHAEIRQFHGINYYNDGDWVESCTALAEDFDGHLSILDWHQLRSELLSPEITEISVTH